MESLNPDVCKELLEGWHPVSQQGIPALPDTETGGLASQPLLFIAAGRIYAGHYHDNGWFYNEVAGLKGELYMARGKWDATRSHDGEVWCEAWKYLRKPIE